MKQHSAKINGKFNYYLEDEYEGPTLYLNKDKTSGRLAFLMPKVITVPHGEHNSEPHKELEKHVKEHLKKTKDAEGFVPEMGDDYWVAHHVHVLPLKVEEIDFEKVKKYEHLRVYYPIAKKTEEKEKRKNPEEKKESEKKKKKE